MSAFVQARYYTSGRLRKIRVVVIHDMEWPEKPAAAEGCAEMFASPNSPRGSAHYNIDNNSWVQSVRDSDTAWGAPNVNADGLHFEHAGFASQDRKQWADPYSAAELKISAVLVAAKCHQYGIPPVHLSVADLKAGKSGIIGHADASAAYTPGGHTDPGAGFPWGLYIGLVRAAYYGTPPPSTPTQLEDIVGTYIEPEGTQPGDGVYWVDGTGVYGVSAVRWGILRKYDGASAKTITRAEYAGLVAQLPKPPAPVDVAALAEALALRLPAGWNAATIAQEIVADLAGRLAQ